MTHQDARPSRLSATIVLVTGAALGLFAWKAAVGDVPRRYPVTLNTAEWMTAPDHGPQAYFRKELYVPGGVLQAWVVVAATDSFVLYVNGKIVGVKKFDGLNVSGIYDLGSVLQPGTNVLGVAARRSSYPGPAMAVVEGAYLDGVGRENRFASDLSWRVASTEQRQGARSTPWHGESFDAGAWAAAKMAGRPSPDEIYSLPAPPTAFSLPPQGEWIRSSSGPTDRVAYSYDFTLPARPDDAWIRVAAVKSYALTINGVLVDGAPRDEFSGFSQATTPVARIDRKGRDVSQDPSGEASTDLYRIESLLRRGPNHMVVSSDRDDAPLAGFFLDGFAASRGTVVSFGTDSTWAVASPVRNEHVSPSQQPATVVLMNEAPLIELPPKRIMSLSVPSGYTARQIGFASVASLVSAAITFMLWLGISTIISVLARVERTEARRWDAVMHLPALLILGAASLLSLDVRFDPGFPFQWRVILIATSALLVLRAGLIAAAWCRGSRTLEETGRSSSEGTRSLNSAYIIALVALIAVGAAFRLWGLDRQSLYHDEVHMVTYVQGLLDRGYPYKMIGPIERPLATYELVPYPIALSALLFGSSDFALRLPAALLGIMTIPLIYFVGGRIFDRRVGLLAAAIYAFCPQAIVWSKYLWHPQQTQFFALLTAYLFYRAMRADALSPRYLYLSALSFIVTYLSWEGAGFLLPGLFVGLLAVKRKDFSWIRQKHLWGAVGLVAVAVTAQLVRRILQQVPYLVVGTGVSDVSYPTLFFLHPLYDPGFYVWNFLWLENNALLTALLICGLPLIRKEKGLAYVTSLLLAILFMMTNFIPHSTMRYAYYLQTFLILAASGVAVLLAERVRDIGRFTHVRWIDGVRVATAVGVCILLVLGSSVFLKLHRANGFMMLSGVHSRPDTYYIDYRTPAGYLKSHYQPEDLVISVVPGALDYYADIPSQYFFESYAARQVIFDPSESSSRYLERTVGVPVLRSASELEGILAMRRRAWVVAIPSTLFSRLAGSEVASYITQRGKVVYESYNARIFLLDD